MAGIGKCRKRAIASQWIFWSGMIEFPPPKDMEAHSVNSFSSSPIPKDKKNSQSPYWEPGPKELTGSQMSQFLMNMSNKYKYSPTWQNLHLWSVTQYHEFWVEFFEYSATRARGFDYASQLELCPELNEVSTMLKPKWFPGVKLNFAANLLHRKGSESAVISYVNGEKAFELTWDELSESVRVCALALRKMGVQKGDRVAGVLVNDSFAVICMLAATSLGAVWSSCSPDFGLNGVHDRLSQVDPKVIFYTQSYVYGSKRVDCTETAIKLLISLKQSTKLVFVENLPAGLTQEDRKDRLKDSEIFKKSEVFSRLAPEMNKEIYSWQEFLEASKLETLKASKESTSLEDLYVDCDFNDPLYIMFSSGTTGKPKCIVHGVGGTLLQHKKELMLHCDLRAQDRMLFFTTCGWMMWNWQVSCLSVGAAIITYDGSPTYPSMDCLWKIVSKEKVSHFGTSPKFIGACAKQGLSLSGQRFDHLRMVLSTGSPLLPEHYDAVSWLLGKNPHLASISGGTDIISCFMLGNPLLPVYKGELQSPGLGMAVEVWDEQGSPINEKKGELVCTKPFVSMPLGFLNDPYGSRYESAYFDSFGGQTKGGSEKTSVVWKHGDYIEKTSRGGFIVHGRSDTTLNPGGVRIGTAEIYRVVENLEEIVDSLVCGLPTDDGDVEVALFVVLSSSVNELSFDDVKLKIRSAVKQELTARHLPAHIFNVSAVPYTRSGKKVEIAVKKIFAGEELDNISAISNSVVLSEYEKIRDMMASS